MAEWEDNLKAKEKLVDETGFFKQIVYVSNDKYDCLPVPFPVKLDAATSFPFIAEEPKGLNNPKYDWNSYQWVDQDAANNSERLNQVEKTLKSVTDQTKTAVDASQKVQNALTNISKGQSNQMADMAKMLKLIAPFLAKENINAAGGANNA